MNDTKKQLDALNNLMPGQSCVYYTGHIAKSSSNPDVRLLRDTAYNMHVEDLAYLTTRVKSRTDNVFRYSVSEFEYIATRKVAPPNPKSVINRRFYVENMRMK